VAQEQAPTPTQERLAANLERVRGRIAQAAARAGRDPGAVRLVAVTKYVGAETIARLLAAGVKDLGENRLQPALPKTEALASAVAAAGARWRMIGHLQSNKARQVLRRFATVDAVDSVHLLECLAREAAKAGRAEVPCLAEVTVSGEEQKYGLRPGELREFLGRAAAHPACRLLGLMCMAPYSEQPGAVSRPVFRRLREILEDANAQRWYAQPLLELSMGMTADFECAVEEGATMVRIGTALYE
jgi:pyridoxal phosphate enzyme (YggS family)